MQTTHFQSGFSLIELAIVLFILSLLLGTLLPPLSAQIEQKEREQTQAQLEEIKEVIYGFAYKNNRLPCPDCRDTSGGCSTMTPNDGIEDPPVAGAACASTGVSTSAVGNLPWVTLGIKESDAWGQYFTYRVTDDFADVSDGTGCGTSTLGVSFELCSDGDITILDSDGGSNVATSIPAIVVSHGKNWTEIPTVHEEENYEDTVTYPGDSLKSFVYKDFSADTVAGFDDLVIWISPHVLRTKMLNAGILP